MANPKHLTVLGKGFETWNNWRRDNRAVVPDFRDEDFRASVLRFSNLSGANLVGVDFGHADLHYADLSRANLAWADLTDANLTCTDFGGAIIGWTTFGAVDLSVAKGLANVIHQGPSTIGVDTLYLSGPGGIPESFLRGAGIPQDFLDNLPPSLLGSPIQFYSCFISYSSNDDEFARRLHADLQAANVRIWFAPEDLRIGDRTRRVIHDTIRLYDKLLVVLTENSVGSDWVEEEVETALQKERRDKSTVLFPIRLDDAVMTTTKSWPETIRDRNIGDFRDWKNHDSYKKALDRLLRDLKASERRPK
jgi:hypothetical protein